MIKFEKDPADERKEFINKLDGYSDTELLKEIVVNQHYQMEIANKNRRNTSVIVWVIAISIILSILATIGGLNSLF
tara:strand:- start:1925 stop:2152 length:228 start_codon:yes stop_codon:yes gene_type:complete